MGRTAPYTDVSDTPLRSISGGHRGRAIYGFEVILSETPTDVQKRVCGGDDDFT